MQTNFTKLSQLTLICTALPAGAYAAEADRLQYVDTVTELGTYINPLYAGELAAQLYELAEEISLEISVDTSRSYAALGEAHSENPYEVIFLEIALSDGDGIEFAEQLRSEDFTTDLVFYSSSSARALEAYGVFPTGYLLKPPQKRRVRHVLEFIRAKRGLTRTLLLRTPGGGRAAIPL